MIPTLYKTFQHWSDGKSVFIYSDPHFDDSDCKLMDPNWPEPKEQIKKINAAMYGKNNTLIILGDIGNPEWIKYITKASYKVLVCGNHDRGRTYYEPYFDEIYEGPVMIAEKIMLSHEPTYIDWCYNIHGHCHGGGKIFPQNSLNVCSNVIDYTPINLKDIINSGVLKQINSLHRKTIDFQTLYSIKSNNTKRISEEIDLWKWK